MRKVLIIFSVLLFSFLNLQAKELRVDIDYLSKNIDSYKVVDVRDNGLFSQGHIKGALNFPINLTYENKSVNGKIVEPNHMQKIVRELGLDIDDKIIIYDNGTYFDSARLFWALEVYGFKDVKLLNGGYEEWDSLDLPISKESIKPTPSNYIASIDNKRLATKFTTQIASKSSAQTIIDARGAKAYKGLVSSAARFGHIPKAIHIPATHNITTNSSIQKLKNLDELEQTYKDVKKDKKVILYCAIGRVSATNYFAMRELGYDVANYDASWKEWGNDFDLPITNPTKK